MASSAPAAGERRMEVGRVFERAFGAVKTNPLVILGIALVIGALPNLLMTVLFASAASTQAVVTGQISFAGFIAAALLSMVVSMVIGVIVQGALTRATVSAIDGTQVSFGDSLATGLRVVLPLIGLAIISSIAIGFGFLLLIVPGVILMLMWSVAVPVLVTERRGVFDSLGRSSELAKGAKGRILGIFIVVFIAYAIVGTILNTIGLAGAGAANGGMGVGNNLVTVSNGGLTVTNVLGSVIGGTLLNAAWGTIQPALYVELRQWKEGTSVEALEQVFA
ncbi:MAG TPA: hypothetical protein VF079_06100 [Sphingomicrobium sp.]